MTAAADDGRGFDREALLAAFDAIGAAAAQAGPALDLLVYGGAALMLASNFRFTTEDVDIAEFARPWPSWFAETVAEVGARNGWSDDWINDAVQFHLSPGADRIADHPPFGTFPRGAAPGLRVWPPTPRYMLALKLKAMRINDPAKGPAETSDIQNLILLLGLGGIEEAIGVLGEYFPRSAKDANRRRFFLKHIWPVEGQSDDPPRYPVLGG